MFENIKINNFFKKVSIYSAVIFFSKFSGFILYPIYFRTLEQSQIYIFELFGVIYLLINTIISLQLNTSLVRNFYEYKSQNKLSILIGNIFFYFFISTIFLLILSISADYFDLFEIDYYILMTLIILYFFNNIFIIIQTILRFEHEDKLFFIISLLYTFLVINFSLIAIFFIAPLAVNLFISNIFAYLLSIVTISFIYKNSLKLKINLDYFPEIISFSFPNILTMLGSFLNQHFSKFLIVTYLTQKDFITYSIALKLGIIYTLFESLFKTIWQPVINKNIEINNKSYFRNIFENYLIFYFFVYLLLGNFSFFIVIFLTSDLYLDSVFLCPLILLAFFFEGFKNIFVIGVFWKKKMFFSTICTYVAGLFNILCCYLLVKPFGLPMISVIFFLSTFIQINLIHFFSNKLVKIKYNMRLFYKISIICLFLSLIYSYNYFHYQYYLSIILNIFITLSFLIILAFDKNFRSILSNQILFIKKSFFL